MPWFVQWSVFFLTLCIFIKLLFELPWNIIAMVGMVFIIFRYAGNNEWYVRLLALHLLLVLTISSSTKNGQSSSFVIGIVLEDLHSSFLKQFRFNVLVGRPLVLAIGFLILQSPYSGVIRTSRKIIFFSPSARLKNPLQTHYLSVI